MGSGRFYDSAHSLTCWQSLSQFAHGSFEHGMAGFRRNFGQRFEYKSTLVEFGMRHRQRRNVDNRRAEEEDVDIDNSRPVLLTALTAHALFEREDSGDELARHFFGIQLSGAVQEPGLGGEFHGFGFVEGRNRGDGSHVGKFVQSGAQVGGAVAEVRAEGEIDDLVHEVDLSAV